MLRPKTVFIAHPMSGDTEGNIAKVVAICRAIHSATVIPVFPSFTTRRYLTGDAEDRAIAGAHIEEYFKRYFVDELWLYGVRITDGMWREIDLATKYGVLVVAKSPGTKYDLQMGHSVQK